MGIIASDGAACHRDGVQVAASDGACLGLEREGTPGGFLLKGGVAGEVFDLAQHLVVGLLELEEDADADGSAYH